MIRDIARTESLHFRMAVIRADMPRALLKQAVREGRMIGMDGMAALTEQDIDDAAHIVGQMGMGPFRRALAEDVDVIIAGRAGYRDLRFAADDAGFSAWHQRAYGEDHRVRLLCCVPGGRDTILATLDREGFELESMNPARHATPTSVAAHSLYEQADPFSVTEPEGRVDLRDAHYAALDDRRTRVAGARWVRQHRPDDQAGRCRLHW